MNWRADVDLLVITDGPNGTYSRAIDHGEIFLDVITDADIPFAVRHAACRCWRCGKLLTADTVTIDRWPVPGIDGGKYTATNTRPACATCNPTTGATVRKGQSGQQLILVTVDELSG